MPGPYDKFCKKVNGIKTYDVFGSHSVFVLTSRRIPAVSPYRAQKASRRFLLSLAGQRRWLMAPLFRGAGRIGAEVAQVHRAQARFHGVVLQRITRAFMPVDFTVSLARQVGRCDLAMDPTAQRIFL